jgi:hypothetical protein
MEITSKLFMCHQALLRPCLRPAGGGMLAGSPLSHCSTSKW